jgi:hypothetical protein
MLFAVAHVWSYWLGVAIAAGAILTAVMVAVGYLNKVVRPKYPPRRP